MNDRTDAPEGLEALVRRVGLRPLPKAADPTEGARRRLVLMAAGFTVFIQVLSMADLVPDVPVGSLDLSLAVVPAMGLAVACGDRLVGRSSIRRVAVWYWIVVTAALVCLAIVFVSQGDADLYTALLVAALGEELIYRVAAPAVIAWLLVSSGVGRGRARLLGLVASGVWFVLLPGHVAQVETLGDVVGFVSFTILATLLVYRSGSVLPMAAAHAVVNMCTVLAWDDVVSTDVRTLVPAGILALLVLAYGRPRRITVDDTGALRDTVTGLPVSAMEPRAGGSTATLEDGRIIEVSETYSLSRKFSQ